MKPGFSRTLRCLAVLCLAVAGVTPRVYPQSTPTLAVQLYAGLSITGSVGSVWAIQYTTNLAQSNAWSCLTFLQLPTTNYLWTDTSVPATGRRFYRAVASSPTNMIFIPPGTFMMGSPTTEVDRYYDESPQMAVTISRGFWMGQHAVTQQEYQAVVGNNPSYFTGDSNRPVEMVSWNDATNYCGDLTQQDLAAGRIPAGSGYRLPTEAEREYACRAWTSTRFSYGDDPGYTNLTDYAWYSANSGGTTHPVGQKLPNPWGLVDMHGNVWEWCQDWYGPYPGGTVIDPQGPATGANRVIRGGSWYDPPANCRSARRSSYPLYANSNFGFRFVLAPSQP